jgi:heptosyltransferase-2
LLTDPQPCSALTRRLHQADYYLALLAGLGITAGRSWQPLAPTAVERNAALERLAAAGWSQERPLIALCPGAGYGSAKRWPLDRYAALAMRLAGEHDATVMVLGGPAERPMGEALAAPLGEKGIDFTGRTSLREALALVSLAAVVVSNDSGLLHLATAAGTPAVALFGPTDPDRTGPTASTVSSVVIVRKPVACSPCELRECPIDHRCMMWLDPDEVYEAVRGHLSTPPSVILCGGPCGTGTTSIVGSPQSELRGGDAPTPQTGHAATDRPRPVVFLDRDGTLNRDIGYLCDPDQLELLPGVGAALRALREAGSRTVIVTNQSGIARGALTEARLELVHQQLRRLLEAEGASVEAIFYCPHHPDDRCRCRKPETELIERARAQLALKSAPSYVVGDKLADVQLAHRIGATSVLVRTGHGEQVLNHWPDGEQPPDHVADDLLAAVDWILGHDRPAVTRATTSWTDSPAAGTIQHRGADR